MRRWLVLSVLATLLMIPPGGALAPSPWQPLAAVGYAVGNELHIGWIPGPVEADEYRVYGVDASGNAELITSTQEYHAVVVPTYVKYYVTGVLDQVESPPTYLIPWVCINVDPDDMPPVTIWICERPPPLDSAAPTDLLP